MTVTGATGLSGPLPVPDLGVGSVAGRAVAAGPPVDLRRTTDGLPRRAPPAGLRVLDLCCGGA